jgi:hypothetical protein
MITINIFKKGNFLRNKRLPIMFIFIVSLVIIFILGLAVFKNRTSTDNLSSDSKLCSKLINTSKKQQCWENLIKEYINSRGIESTFVLMSDIENNDKTFVQSCHGFTHLLGYSAYKYWAQGKEFKISNRTSMCNFGFYHGFMEALILNKKSITEARKFCAYVAQQMKGQTDDAGLQCYHGIGHGTVNADNRPQVWGNASEIIKPAVEICNKVSQTRDELYRCSSGIFNGLANFYIQGEYGLKLDKKDPAGICAIQPESFKEACYGNMDSAILSAFDNNFLQAANYVENIKDINQVPKTIEYLATEWSGRNFNNTDYKSVVLTCRLLPANLQNDCVHGIERGYFETNPNYGNEYKKVIDFCKTPAMTSGETNTCYEFILPYLWHQYPNIKYHEICKSIKIEYQKYCVLK